jgi:profilin
LSGPEVTAIAKGFDDPDPLFGTGIIVGGHKYYTIRADSTMIQGRKVQNSYQTKSDLQGDEGIVCMKTKQAILVAHYPAGAIAGAVVDVVFSLGNYLITVNY